MKGDVKRKSFSDDWSGEFCLASSPFRLNTTIVNTRVWHLFSTLWAREAKVIRRREQASRSWIKLTRVLSEARRPMAFLGQARRHSVDVETSPRRGKPRLSLSWMLILVARVPPGTLATRAPETLRTRGPWKRWWPSARWRFPALSLLGTFDSVVPSFLP